MTLNLSHYQWRGGGVKLCVELLIDRKSHEGVISLQYSHPCLHFCLYVASIMQINALIKVPILPDPLSGCVESAHETTSHYPSKQDGALHVQVGILNSAKQLWSPVVRRALQKGLQFPPGLLKMLYMYVGGLLLPQLHHRI